MRRYRGSHEDFDCFVVPTVPALKQQQDTIATLVDLSRLGLPASKIRLVFNMVESVLQFKTTFFELAGLAQQKLFHAGGGHGRAGTPCLGQQPGRLGRTRHASSERVVCRMDTGPGQKAG